MANWYFSRPYWLYWTVAGRGARDGRINHPRDNVTQRMNPASGHVDLVGSFLREIETQLGVQGAKRPQSAAGDYDRSVQALETVMRARNSPLDSLPANSRRELIKVMADLIDQQAQSKESDANSLTHYEAELIAIAEEKIEAIWESWEVLHNSIEAKAGHVQHEWLNAFREYEALNELHSQKEYRQPHPLIGGWFYASILIGLGLAEYWINMIAFQLWFVKDSLELYLSATLPSIVIPFFAHVVGTQLRYWQGKKELGEKIRWQSVVIVIGSLLVALFASASLVWLRSKFVSEAERLPVDLSQAVSVLALNVAGLCAGIAAAYIAHDVDAALENICTRKKTLLKHLHKTWQRWAQLAAEFDVLRGKSIARVGIIRSDTVAKIMEYRDYNIRYRADSAIPSVFKCEVGDRFFKARDFSHELSLTPPPVSEVEAIFRAQSGAARDPSQSADPDQFRPVAKGAPMVEFAKSSGEAA